MIERGESVPLGRGRSGDRHAGVGLGRATGLLSSGATKLAETRFYMPTSRHCLLIVDDEPHVCDSVYDLLRREFRVLKANSAQDGYRIMQEEEVHIVMSDQRMPHVTGVELLTKVKVRYPHAIRMLFTGYADLESIIAAINQGHIFQFMKKPWQPEELQAAVRQAAAEFDRLEAAARERENLVVEIGGLKDRVTTLETEVRRLQQATANRADGN
jgi:response regulator RpfG family c-di-GMP phosphodiesterase